MYQKGVTNFRLIQRKATENGMFAILKSQLLQNSSKTTVEHVIIGLQTADPVKMIHQTHYQMN